MPEEPIIDLHSDDYFMGEALRQAAKAYEKGEVPVGAVALIAGCAVSARHNERERTGDPTAHAEMLALRDAAAAVGGWRLSEVTVVVTLEPCPMCAGALVAARVSRLVYGASDPRAGACGTLYNLCGDPRLNHELMVTNGIRADDCGALLTSFFAEKRSQHTATGSSLTSSMYRDLKKGAPVEADSILGDLIERGQKHHISTPILQAAFAGLSIYQHEIGR